MFVEKKNVFKILIKNKLFISSFYSIELYISRYNYPFGKTIFYYSIYTFFNPKKGNYFLPKTINENYQ